VQQKVSVIHFTTLKLPEKELILSSGNAVPPAGQVRSVSTMSLPSTSALFVDLPAQHSLMPFTIISILHIIILIGRIAGKFVSL
jgi:hypothetical protein